MIYGHAPALPLHLAATLLVASKSPAGSSAQGLGQGPKLGQVACQGVPYNAICSSADSSWNDLDRCLRSRAPLDSTVCMALKTVIQARSLCVCFCCLFALAHELSREPGSMRVLHKGGI